MKGLLRTLRLLLVLAIIVSSVYFVTFAGYQVCESTTSADGSVTSVCGSPAITDIRVLAVAALVVLLLAPDLSEIDLFGLSIKRRIEAAELVAERAEEHVGKLENLLAIQQVRIDNVISSTSSAQANLIVTSEQLQRLSSGIASKAEDYQSNKPTGIESVPVQSVSSSENSELRTRLLQLWETLSSASGESAWAVESSGRPLVESEKAARFRMLFADEINAVRQARNAVAHALPISEQDLRAAIELAENLIEIAQQAD